ILVRFGCRQRSGRRGSLLTIAPTGLILRGRLSRPVPPRRQGSAPGSLRPDCVPRGPYGKPLAFTRQHPLQLTRGTAHTLDPLPRNGDTPPTDPASARTLSLSLCSRSPTRSSNKRWL